MSQSTYGDHDDWFRSTLSYDERGAALFGSSSSSSSSGSEYDTEDALSQPTTDNGCVENVEETTVPPRPVPRRDRDQSPVTVRYGSPQGHVPRRPRDLSPVSVRYVASQVRGPDGRHQQTQLCLNRVIAPIRHESGRTFDSAPSRAVKRRVVPFGLVPGS